jgi:hypothetical protein
MTRHPLLLVLRCVAICAMMPIHNGCSVMLMSGGSHGSSAVGLPPAPASGHGMERQTTRSVESPVPGPSFSSNSGSTAAPLAVRGSESPVPPPLRTVDRAKGKESPLPQRTPPVVPIGKSDTVANQAVLPRPPAPRPPPTINNPGAASATPPAASLPPPVDTSERCLALCKKFGIRSIGGTNASYEELDTLDKVFSNLPPGLYMNLAIDYEPTSAKPSEANQPHVAAYWTLAREDGSKLGETFRSPEGRGGRMFLFRSTNTEWTITHETCHHISMLADRTFGAQMAADLGYLRVDGQSAIDDVLDAQEWSRSQRFDPSTCPTDYSFSKWKEHIAELMTAYIRGPLGPTASEGRIRPGFAGPGTAQTTLATRMGSRAGTMGTSFP